QRPLNNGWVENFIRAKRNPCDVMRVYNHQSVPVISTLATEFALLDNWHCSVPGPTFPNRLYVHSGTSYGHGTNNLWQSALGCQFSSFICSLSSKQCLCCICNLHQRTHTRP